MPKIRWRQKDEELVAEVVKRFNAKLRRLEKSHPELMPYQPEPLKKRDLIANLKAGTRADFNVLMNRYQRYLRRGSEQAVVTKAGVKTSRYIRAEASQAIQTINKRRRAQAQKVKTEHPGMGSDKELNLKQRANNVDKIKPANWQDFTRNLERQLLSSGGMAKQQQYKENYLRALESMGMSDTPAYVIVKSLDSYEVFEALTNNEDFLSIDFIYGEEAWADRANQISLLWNEYAMNIGKQTDYDEDSIEEVILSMSDDGDDAQRSYWAKSKASSRYRPHRRRCNS